MVSQRIRPLDARGFSLAEVLVVAALIGVLAAVSAPLFVNYLRAATVRAGAQELRSALNQAKQLAIATRQNICVQVVAAPANGFQFRQGGCNGPAWLGPGTDSTGTFRMQNGVTVTNAGASPAFTWLGAAAPAGTFSVTGPNGASLTVTVSAAGRISTP